MLLLALFLIAAGACSGQREVVTGDSVTCCVDPSSSDGYASIQDALRDCGPSSETIILNLAPGVYDERKGMQFGNRRRAVILEGPDGNCYGGDAPSVRILGAAHASPIEGLSFRAAHVWLDGNGTKDSFFASYVRPSHLQITCSRISGFRGPAAIFAQGTCSRDSQLDVVANYFERTEYQHLSVSGFRRIAVLNNKLDSACAINETVLRIGKNGPGCVSIDSTPCEEGETPDLIVAENRMFW